MIPQRILNKFVVNEVNGCWEWIGYVQPSGYGRVSFNGTMQFAHRVVYTLCKGDICEGLYLDHLCRIRACVNPDHLDPVTHAENVIRGHTWRRINDPRLTCKQGHPWTEDNIGADRGCKKCKNKREVIRRAARRLTQKGEA